MATRRDFIVGSAQCVGAVAAIEGHLSAGGRASSASFVDVSADTKTIAGEPLEYPSTPNPVIFSNVVTITARNCYSMDGPSGPGLSLRA